MEEQYISFKTAKLAKKRGFDLTQRISNIALLYDKSGKHCCYTNYGFMYSGLSEGYISAPTQAFLTKWLREVHNIQVYVNSQTKNGGGKYRDYVAHVNGREINDARDEEYQTYEQAMEAGLQVALSEIKTR